MRLLRADVEGIQIETFYDGDIPDYAILSHTWLADDEEIIFAERHDPDLQAKAGWPKLVGCKRQAFVDGWKYVWIDTLCIDKSSSAELSEAINSMYQYYQQAKVCYIFLEDMPDPDPPGGEQQDDASTACGPDQSGSRDILVTGEAPSDAKSVYDGVPALVVTEPGDLGMQDLVSNDLRAGSRVHFIETSERAGLDLDAFRRCRWFTRGWTLQELLAPTSLHIFTRSWSRIALNQKLLEEISRITRIHYEALARIRSRDSYSVAQRMSWAANRTTRRIEDRAYSLLGIFDVELPVVYGEGKRAFRRLQESLLEKVQDQSIFAFDILSNADGSSITAAKGNGNLLAESPDAFSNSGDVVQTSAPSYTQVSLVKPEVHFTSLGVSAHYRRGLCDGIVLACGLASHPTGFILLNIYPSPLRVENISFIQSLGSLVGFAFRRKRREHAYVTPVGSRLTFVDIYADASMVSRTRTPDGFSIRKLTKVSWRVACSAEDYASHVRLGDPSSPSVLVCRWKCDKQLRREKDLIEFKGTSLVGTWSENSRAFTLPTPAACLKFDGSLEVWLNGLHISTLFLKHHKVRFRNRELPLRVFDLRVRFASSILPGRWWEPFGDLQWHNGRLLIAHAFHAWIAPDGRLMSLVTIQYLDPISGMAEFLAIHMSIIIFLIRAVAWLVPPVATIATFITSTVILIKRFGSISTTVMCILALLIATSAFVTIFGGVGIICCFPWTAGEILKLYLGNIRVTYCHRFFVILFFVSCLIALGVGVILGPLVATNLSNH